MCAVVGLQVPGGWGLFVVLCDVINGFDTRAGVLAGADVDGGRVHSCITYKNVAGCAVGRVSELPLVPRSVLL